MITAGKIKEALDIIERNIPPNKLIKTEWGYLTLGGCGNVFAKNIEELK